MVMPGTDPRGPAHQLPPLPPLAEVATKIREGEHVDDLAAIYRRQPATLRGRLTAGGWDPETGAEAVKNVMDLAELWSASWSATWMDDALCAQADPEEFFPARGSSSRAAKQVCLRCEVRSVCGDYAIENGIRRGIWGGLEPRERRAVQGPGAQDEVA